MTMDEKSTILANTIKNFTIFGLDPRNVTYASVTDMIAETFAESPYHWMIEATLTVFVVYLIFFRRALPDPEKLTEKDKDELVRAWQPEPLVKPVSKRDMKKIQSIPIVESLPGVKVVVDGKECINMANYNFLNMAENSQHHETAIQTLNKYGCGTCGPRGFYGTIDKHLDLENRVAEFLGVEQAILYSYGFSTISSSIPAFAKRGDIIIADKAVSYATQTGVLLSRSHVYWYEHNDMEDLERILKDQQQKRAGLPLVRQFIVTEGIFPNTGTICNLPKIIDLKNKYKYRLILEETSSFGVLGKTGRGVVEHFNADRSEVLFSTAALSSATGSIGGFCAGTKEVVDHQRLSGQGYCFSASLPTMLATFAHAAIDALDSDPSPLARLKANAKRLHAGLAKIPNAWTSGDVAAPIQHVGVATACAVGDEEDDDTLDAVVAYAREKGVAFTRAAYVRSAETFPWPHSIRVTVSANHTAADIDKALAVLKEAFTKYVKKAKK